MAFYGSRGGGGSSSARELREDLAVERDVEEACAQRVGSVNLISKLLQFEQTLGARSLELRQGGSRAWGRYERACKEPRYWRYRARMRGTPLLPP
jgi:hypothetical protein